ncbi:MAG: chromate transporter [Ignisphaera sp.]
MGMELIELFLTFLKIGFVMFGGGYAMIPILRYEVVLRHQWISEQELIDIIAVAESTPGPIAVNSATYVGYKVGGFLGAFLATIAIVLPAFMVMLAIAIVLMKFYGNYLVRGVLNGIRGAVLGLILSTVLMIVKGIVKGVAISNSLAIFFIAITVFICVTFLDIDPVILIGASALIGLVLAFLKVW